jgi:DNA-binding SARP family transcriptional activator/DNA-binding CsgD family transcriptional regulator
VWGTIQDERGVLPIGEGTMARSPVLRISMLGGFRIAIGQEEIPVETWRRRKAAALIKLLALAPDRRLHREELVEWLWPELTPAAGVNNLHRTLHVARRILEPDRPPAAPPSFLALQGDLLILARGGVSVIDVDAFRQAAGEARRTREPAALHAAIGLYTGDLLPADRYEDWATACREELRSTFLHLLADLARAQEDRGDRAAATETWRRLIREEPVHEDAHTALMRLYARAGDRHQALRQFELLRQALRRSLDAEPSPTSRRLYEAIRAGWCAGESALLNQSGAALTEANVAVVSANGRVSRRRAGAASAQTTTVATESPPDEPRIARTGNPLSAREREVAALVARGLTNRQIADGLGMSQRTADKHVSNILKKLDVSSRRQVAVRVVS